MHRKRLGHFRSMARALERCKLFVLGCVPSGSQRDNKVHHHARITHITSCRLSRCISRIPKGRLQCVRELLQRGADSMAEDHTGRTPLSAAHSRVSMSIGGRDIFTLHAVVPLGTAKRGATARVSCFTIFSSRARYSSLARKHCCVHGACHP